MKQYLTFLGLLVSAILTGCGGGGGASSDTDGSSYSSVFSSSSTESTSSASSAASAIRSSYAASSFSSSSASSVSSGNSLSSLAASSSGTSEIDSGFAPESVSGELLRNRPGHVNVGDVFEHGIPITEAAALITSDRAVTLNANHDRLNLERHGRYLEIDSANDNIREFVVGFDGADIAAALEGVDTDDILSAQLFLWNESGRSMDLQLNAFTSPFNENTIVSRDELSNFTTIGTVHVNGDIGEKHLDIPLGILLDWLSDPTGAYGLLLEASEFGGKLRFSSDETSRPPTLVVSYRKRSLLPEEALQVYATQSDNEQCVIRIDSEHSVLREGNEFVFHISVTDNAAIDYYNFKVWRDDGGTMTAPQSAYIYNPGHTYLGYELHGKINSDAPINNSYLHINVYADDVSGLAPYCTRFARIPIFKNDKPLIESSMEYLDVIDVRPDYYRLIKNDKQRIRIKATASDESDAIAYMLLWLPGDTAPRRFNSNTIDYTWTNGDFARDPDEFKYTIKAVDTTGNFTTYESEAVPIRGWDELKLYNHALTFGNFSRTSEMSKSYLNYIYGTDEVTGRFGNYTIKALEWYSALKDIGSKGNCFGMSGTSIALTTGQESLEPSNFQPGATTTAELDPPTNRVKVFVHAKQGSQLSKNVLEETYRYHNHHQDELDWTLNKVLNSLDGEFSNYGSLNILEGDSGHSIVPWMARRYAGGDWKVFVYDSNKIGGVNAIQKSLGEPLLSDEHDFPYVEFNLTSNSWRYIIGWFDQNPIFWNDDIFFISHSSVVGNTSYNAIRSDLHIRDHNLPSTLRSIWESIGSSAVLSTESNDNIGISIEDETGNTTLRAENFGGNGAIAIRTLTGDVSSAGLFIIPNDKPMTVRVHGYKSGTYSLNILTGHLAISIEGKTIGGQQIDTYKLIPDKDDPDTVSLSVLSAMADSTFTINASFGYMKADKQELISAEKIYRISNMTLQAGIPMDISLNRYAEALTVHSEQKSGFSFNLTVEETDKNGDLTTRYASKVTPPVISGKSVYNFNLTDKRTQ